MYSPQLDSYVAEHGYTGSPSQGEISTRCPACAHPKARYYVNTVNGLSYCHHCQIKGNVNTIIANNNGHHDGHDRNIITTPRYEEINYLSKSYVYDAHNLLVNDPKGRNGLTYVTVDRGLTLPTIKTFQLGYDLEKRAIVIPHHNQDGRIIGVKFRYIDPDTEPKYTYAKGSQASLYNINTLHQSPLPWITLTEGEFDTMAAHQVMSNIPILGVPGMNSFKKAWFPLFDDFERIYIAFDNERSADERAEELAKLLKDWRCWRIKLPDKIKDINELVIRCGTPQNVVRIWQDLVKEAKCIGRPLTKTTQEYVPETIDYYHNKAGNTISTGYEPLDQAMGGFSPGRVYLVRGATKLGKTTFTLNLMMNVALAGHKALIGSFEMKVATEMLIKIANRFLGRDIEKEPKLSPTQLTKVLQTIQSSIPIEWINRHDRLRLGELYDAIKIKYQEGFRFLLLDHVQFMMNLGSSKEGAVFSETVKVSKFIKRLTNDFPELIIVAITELNKMDETMGGKSLEYDCDVILNYYGTGLTVVEHRMDSNFKGKTVQIRWNSTTHNYSVY